MKIRQTTAVTAVASWVFFCLGALLSKPTGEDVESGFHSIFASGFLTSIPGRVDSTWMLQGTAPNFHTKNGFKIP